MKTMLTWLPAAALLGVISATNVAIASDGVGDQKEPVAREDNRPDPLTTRQLELKKVALEAKLHGKAYGRTHQVARGQYVQLEREGEGAVWTVLGEFSDLPHNTMPEPDRSTLG